jgi:hypothetical protein
MMAGPPLLMTAAGATASSARPAHPSISHTTEAANARGGAGQGLKRAPSA